ncbi:Uncharacterised protein [uncultured archaeon]|nr:Uncharacterised protein [uncultured archaeon]
MKNTIEHKKIYIRQTSNELLVGIIVAIIILILVAVVLFTQITSGLKQGEGLTGENIFRGALFVASVFAIFSCTRAIITINDSKKTKTSNIEETFQDFATFASPLVQEVIVARMVNEKLIERLDALQGSVNYETSKKVFDQESLNWGEFLMQVGLLGSASVGLFVFLDQHPFNLVPYSLMLLAIGWYVIIANFFNAWEDSRSYYIVAIFMLIVPSLSIALRAVFEYNQALYYTFIGLLIYVYALYSYIKYIKTGLLPKSIQTILDKVTKEATKKASQKEKKESLEKESRSILDKAISSIRARQKSTVSELEEPRPGIFTKITEETKIFHRLIPYKIFARFKSLNPATILYNFGKIILIAGMVSIIFSTIGFLMDLPFLSPEKYVESGALGLILLVSGFSLMGKKYIPISGGTIIIYLLGIFLSGAGVLLFQILTLDEFISNIILLLLLYVGGLGLLIIDIFINRRKKKLKMVH